MSPGDLYVIPDSAEEAGDDETWIQPQSIDEVVIDALLDATEYEADDIDSLREYVDYDELAALFEEDASDDTLSFPVEDHEVTVHQSGEVEVEG